MIQTQQERKVLTYDEAAEYLGLPKGTLYAMTSRKEIPHYRLSSRNVRFVESELRAWLLQKHIPVTNEGRGRK